MKIDLKLLTEMIEEQANESETSYNFVEDGYAKNTPYSIVSEIVLADFLQDKPPASKEDIYQDSRLGSYVSDKFLLQRETLKPFYDTMYSALQKMKFAVRADGKTQTVSVKDLLRRSPTSVQLDDAVTGEVDINTDTSDIHVKFNEKSEKANERLIGFQSKENIDGNFQSVQNIWKQVLKDEIPNLIDGVYICKNDTCTTQEYLNGKFITGDGRLVKGKSLRNKLRKDNPELAKKFEDDFTRAKKEYQSTVNKNAEYLVEKMNEKGFEDLLSRQIHDQLLSRLANADGEKKDIVFARFFHPTKKNKNYNSEIQLERISIQDLPGGKEAPLFYRYVPSEQGIKVLIYPKQMSLFNEALSSDEEVSSDVPPIMGIEFRTDGEGHPLQLKTGLGYSNYALKTSTDDAKSNVMPVKIFKAARDLEKDIEKFQKAQASLKAGPLDKRQPPEQTSFTFEDLENMIYEALKKNP